MTQGSASLRALQILSKHSFLDLGVGVLGRGLSAATELRPQPDRELQKPSLGPRRQWQYRSAHPSQSMFRADSKPPLDASVSGDLPEYADTEVYPEHGLVVRGI